jgi:hypothetical protein
MQVEAVRKQQRGEYLNPSERKYQKQGGSWIVRSSMHFAIHKMLEAFK